MCMRLQKSIKTEKFYQKISDFTSFLKKIGAFKGFFKDLRLFMTTPPTCVLQGKIMLPRRSFLAVICFQIWGEWGRLPLVVSFNDIIARLAAFAVYPGFFCVI